MPKLKGLIPTLTLIIIIVLAFAGGYMLGRGNASRNNIPASGEAAQRQESVRETWDIILSDYVEQSRIDTANLSRSAIEGMLKTLEDPYSSYLDEEQYALGTSLLEGSFNGIGAYVTVEDGKIVIIAPIADSPADKAGIRAGDVILQIDGESAADMSLAEAIIKIRGQEGTAVKLLILHEGDTEPVEKEIVRAAFDIPSIRFEMMEEFAYINITDFTERTADELAEAIESLKEANAAGIILDLRGNPGGLLDAVVDIASSFLTEGTVVKIRSNQGEETVINVASDKPKTDLPMVVLVDEGSASGSEVLAGALQDHDRAVIAGTTTYGKGSVNALYPLIDGSGLYITTGRWLTPDDRLIEGQGIQPDIPLEFTGDEAVQWALEYLRENAKT